MVAQFHYNPKTYSISEGIKRIISVSISFCFPSTFIDFFPFCLDKMSDLFPTEESPDEFVDSEWNYATSENSVATWPSCEADREDEPEANESPLAATTATYEDDTGEEPEEKESPLAKLIIEDLAAGPPLTCRVWNNALQTLSAMPSSRRTARALLDVLQPAIRDENEHWVKLTAMSESLHIGSIQNLHFNNEVWECIQHLAGHTELSWDDCEGYNRAPEWLDVQDIVRALHNISDRIKGKCFGDRSLRDYDFPRGVKRYESLWKTVVEILGEGRKGARMQAYVDALLESSSLPNHF